DTIDERCLHQSRSRACCHEGVLTGGEQRLQIIDDAAEELFELRAAVADHRPSHRPQDLRSDPRRTGDEEPALLFRVHTRYARTASSLGPDRKTSAFSLTRGRV